MDKFLTEYVYDTDRIMDGAIDFKTDIAIRGDVANYMSKSKHKADKEVGAFIFLMNIPTPLFDYSVDVLKEYIKEDRVSLIAQSIKERKAPNFLFVNKVLADLETEMNVAKETIKSIYCRFIEDLCQINIDLAKELTEETLQTYSLSYLHDVATIYLMNINNHIKTIDSNKEVSEDIKFMSNIICIMEMNIKEAPTLTKEKSFTFTNNIMTDIICGKKKESNNEEDTIQQKLDDFINSLKGTNVSVEVYSSDNALLTPEQEQEEFRKIEKKMKNTKRSIAEMVAERFASAMEGVAIQTEKLSNATGELSRAAKESTEKTEKLKDEAEDIYFKTERMKLDLAGEDGHKYKVVKKTKSIVNPTEISSKVFNNERQALEHLENIKNNRRYLWDNFDYSIERAD